MDSVGINGGECEEHYVWGGLWDVLIVETVGIVFEC